MKTPIESCLLSHSEKILSSCVDNIKEFLPKEKNSS